MQQRKVARTRRAAAAGAFAALALALTVPGAAAKPDPGGGGSGSPPPKKSGTVGKVVSGSVAVRTGPGTGYAVKTRLKRGTRVYIACQARATRMDGPRARNWPWWNRITSPVWGWVSDAYINSGSGNRAAPTCPNAKPRHAADQVKNPKSNNKNKKKRKKGKKRSKPYKYPKGMRINEGRRVPSVPAGVYDADQCAFGDFRPEAQYAGNDWVAFCWAYKDDRIYVKDTLVDSAASAVYYKYSRRKGDLHAQAEKDGLCINSHGGGTWATCALRIRGQDRSIKLYGALLDRDRNHRNIGLWKEKGSKKSDYVTTEPFGIECELAREVAARCEPLSADGIDLDEGPR